MFVARGVVQINGSWYAWVGERENLVGPYQTEAEAIAFHG